MKRNKSALIWVWVTAVLKPNLLNPLTKGVFSVRFYLHEIRILQWVTHRILLWPSASPPHRELDHNKIPESLSC